jgi:parallel beta-helix repeat protein
VRRSVAGTVLLASTLLTTAALLSGLPGTAQEPTLAEWLQRAAKSGGTVEVRRSPPPGFAVRLSVPKGKQLVFRALDPITLDGGGTQDIGLRVLSGGRLVVEGPVTLQNYRQNAIRATLCEGLSLRGITFRNTGQAAVLTGRTGNVRIEGCTVEDSKSHGLYVSEGGTGIVIRGNTIRRVGSIGIHANGCPYRFRKVTISENTITDAGNSAVQVAAVTGAVIAGNSFARTRQGIVAWNDGRNKCRSIGVDLRGQVGPYSIHRSSQGTLLPGTRRLAH